MNRQTRLIPRLLLSCLLLAAIFTISAATRSASAENRTSPAHTGIPNAGNRSITTDQPGNRVCGTVSSFTAATTGQTGSLTVGGMSFTIAAGVSLQGITVGSNVCLTLCIDPASGHITGVSSVSFSGSDDSSTICGFVTEFKNTYLAPGLIVIGGKSFKIAETVLLPGRQLAVPGAYLCLTPVLANGVLTTGSYLSAATPAVLQFSTPMVVDGTTNIYGPPHGTDQFLLPQPMVFTVTSPAPEGTSVFSTNESNFGQFYPIEGTTAHGLSLSTPSSAVRALTCADSFWDGIFQLATTGDTEGDMITFFLQTPTGSKSEIVAMFTMENGGAKLTQSHKDVSVLWGPGRRPIGSVFPLSIPAGSSGKRTPTLAFALSMTPSSPLNGCFQLGIEIKRGAGAGKTSVVFSYVQVKRMETPDDHVMSISTGIFSGSLGWYPTGKICDVVCNGCVTIPQNPPPSNSLSGLVFCDNNDDGIRQSGESGLSGVKVVLSGTVSKEVFTDANGEYHFKELPAGTYAITEVQPSGVMDGKDTLGTLGGTLGNDVMSGIVLPENGAGSGYNFAEKCMNKCDTICWKSTQYYITFIRNLPGGAVLIPGVNANNPVGIQQSLNAVRSALNGGNTPMLRLSKEFVTGQLSVASAGGQGSPVVFNTYWSPLSCSGLSFNAVTLSNGFTFTPSTLLNDLVEQTTLAIKQNRSDDYEKLASLWAMLNGRC